MERTKLPRELAIKLYYISYQAGRSLHKGLGACWDEFRAFYSEERVIIFRKTLDDFRALSRRAEKEGMAYRTFIAWWLPRRWQRWFSLDAWEAAYLEFVLSSFLNVLSSAEKPDSVDYLIALRMALTNCTILLEERLVSGTEEVDHFGRAGWIRPVQLDELLQRAGCARETLEVDKASRSVATAQSSGDSRSQA